MDSPSSGRWPRSSRPCVAAHADSSGEHIIPPKAARESGLLDFEISGRMALAGDQHAVAASQLPRRKQSSSRRRRPTSTVQTESLSALDPARVRIPDDHVRRAGRAGLDHLLDLEPEKGDRR